MAKHLNDEQGRTIDELLSSGESTPAEETIGDSIKRLLKLSDKEYQDLHGAIANHVEAFFGRLATTTFP